MTPLSDISCRTVAASRIYAFQLDLFSSVSSEASMGQIKLLAAVVFQQLIALVINEMMFMSCHAAVLSLILVLN